MSPLLTAVPRTRKPIGLPHSLDLSVLFKDFILYWAGWRVFLEDEGIPGKRYIWKEWQVSLQGSVQGTLTFRTTDSLIRSLWDSQSIQGRDFSDAEAAFREMAALYATHMVRSLWKGHFLGLDPLMARPAGTAPKPSLTQCHTYCRLWMNDEPLEIRLWMDPGSNYGGMR